MFQVEPVGDGVAETIKALPADLLAPFAELWAELETRPWEVGRPYVARRPDGARSVDFGPDGSGLVLFGIVQRELRVLMIQVTFY